MHKLHERFHELSQYATLNNAVLAAAVVIALGWVWGSMDALQRNYTLQQQVDAQKNENEILSLQNQNLQAEQNYLGSSEYLQLAARDKLDKALPGEKELILPETTPSTTSTTGIATPAPASNFSQWMSFLLGKDRS